MLTNLPLMMIKGCCFTRSHEGSSYDIKIASIFKYIDVLIYKRQLLLSVIDYPSQIKSVGTVPSPCTSKYLLPFTFLCSLNFPFINAKNVE